MFNLKFSKNSSIFSICIVICFCSCKTTYSKESIKTNYASLGRENILKFATAVLQGDSDTACKFLPTEEWLKHEWDMIGKRSLSGMKPMILTETYNKYGFWVQNEVHILIMASIIHSDMYKRLRKKINELHHQAKEKKIPLDKFQIIDMSLAIGSIHANILKWEKTPDAGYQYAFYKDSKKTEFRGSSMHRLVHSPLTGYVFVDFMANGKKNTLRISMYDSKFFDTELFFENLTVRQREDLVCIDDKISKIEVSKRISLMLENRFKKDQILEYMGRRIPVDDIEKNEWVFELKYPGIKVKLQFDYYDYLIKAFVDGKEVILEKQSE